MKVGVLFVDTERQSILLQKKKDALQWSTFIHFLESDETMHECMRRELFTTIGYKMNDETDVRFLGYDECTDEPTIVLWHCVVEKQKNMRPHEGLEIKWFSWRLLPPMCQELKQTINQSKLLFALGR